MHTPFYTAQDLSFGLSNAQAKIFERVYCSKLCILNAAAKTTNIKVVHGYGIVARRDLVRGESFIDPCAAFCRGEASEEDAAAGAVVVAQGEECLADGGDNDAFYFRLRSDARATPTFYLNEARDVSEPNVEYLVVPLGRPALGWRVVRDIPEGAELLVAYDAPDA